MTEMAISLDNAITRLCIWMMITWTIVIPRFECSRLEDVIPGDPGLDYPVLSRIPVTQFQCFNRNSGYYADLETRCQVFHVCNDNRQSSFLCPNGTLFNQQYFVCDWWFNVDCKRAPSLYTINQKLFATTPSPSSDSRFSNSPFHSTGIRMADVRASTPTPSFARFDKHPPLRNPFRQPDHTTHAPFSRFSGFGPSSTPTFSRSSGPNPEFSFTRNRPQLESSTYRPKEFRPEPTRPSSSESSFTRLSPTSFSSTKEPVRAFLDSRTESSPTSLSVLNNWVLLAEEPHMINNILTSSRLYLIERNSTLGGLITATEPATRIPNILAEFKTPPSNQRQQPDIQIPSKSVGLVTNNQLAIVTAPPLENATPNQDLVRYKVDRPILDTSFKPSELLSIKTTTGFQPVSSTNEFRSFTQPNPSTLSNQVLKFGNTVPSPSPSISPNSALNFRNTVPPTHPSIPPNPTLNIRHTEPQPRPPPVRNTIPLGSTRSPSVTNVQQIANFQNQHIPVTIPKPAVQTFNTSPNQRPITSNIAHTPQTSIVRPIVSQQQPVYFQQISQTTVPRPITTPVQHAVGLNNKPGVISQPFIRPAGHSAANNQAIRPTIASQPNSLLHSPQTTFKAPESIQFTASSVPFRASELMTGGPTQPSVKGPPLVQPQVRGIGVQPPASAFVRPVRTAFPDVIYGKQTHNVFWTNDRPVPAMFPRRFHDGSSPFHQFIVQPKAPLLVERQWMG